MIAALTGGRSPNLRRVVPQPVRHRLRPLRAAWVDWRRRRPPKLGDLRRVTPIDPNWGFERGTPIDRVYVEEFVGGHAADIRGRVLEIAAPDYTTRFGRGVERSDILMATEGNPQATIVGDLTDAPQIPSDTFDCAIVTQTLQFVYDVRAALATLHRVLAPGGVLLATVPGITKISPPEDERVRRVVALHRALDAAARGGGVRRRERRDRRVRQCAERSRIPLRPRRLRPAARGARGARSALRGDRRPQGREVRGGTGSALGASRRAGLARTPVPADRAPERVGRRLR